MVTTLLIKGHRKWAVSPSHSFLCIHTHTEKAQKWMMQHFSWPEGYTSSREGEGTCGQLHMWFSLPRCLWDFPEPHGSRIAFPQDTSDRVLATRVHQTVKFSILALKIPHCFTCKVLNVCLGSDYRCHHGRSWDFCLTSRQGESILSQQKWARLVFSYVSRAESLGYSDPAEDIKVFSFSFLVNIF